MATIQPNPNWDRWVFATMTKDFVAAFTSLDVDLFIEGTHRAVPNELEALEFRMDGPQVRQPTRGCFYLEFEINILVRSMMDDTDFHKMRQLTGRVREWLSQAHCIFRYGDGVDDDSTFLGTLNLDNRSPLDPVRTNHFGQVDSKYRMEEATIEGSFTLNLTVGD